VSSATTYKRRFAALTKQFGDAPIDSLFRALHDEPCDIQEQHFVVQFILHPQLMSSINASYAGC
jgi:hypothetical protein